MTPAGDNSSAMQVVRAATEGGGIQGDLPNFSPPVSGGGCWGGGGGHVPWNCPLLDPWQVEDSLL